MMDDLRKIIFLAAKKNWPQEFKDKLRHVLSDPAFDGKSFLKTARSYRISQLLYFQLKNNNSLDLLDNEIQESLKKDYIETAGVNLLYFAQLKEILAKFEAQNIDYLVLKGAALSYTLYNNPGLRPFADIDLLIKHNDLERASNILAGDFKLITPVKSQAAAEFYFHYNFQRKISPKLSIELHWALISPSMPLRLDLSKFWENRQEVFAPDFKFYAPQNEFLLLHQALHFSNHYFCSWRDLWDIDWFANGDKNLEWGKIVDFAKEYNIGERIYYPLFWARKLLAANVPDDVLKSLEPGSAGNFLGTIEKHGGLLKEPSEADKNFRVVIEYFLLPQKFKAAFYEKLVFPGIAWLSIFPDEPSEYTLFGKIKTALRGLRLIFYIHKVKFSRK